MKMKNETYSCETMTGIANVIEEQSETIMRQADTISRLSSLLLQHCQMTKEELAGVLREEEIGK